MKRVALALTTVALLAIGSWLTWRSSEPTRWAPSTQDSPRAWPENAMPYLNNLNTVIS